MARFERAWALRQAVLDWVADELESGSQHVVVQPDDLAEVLKVVPAADEFELVGVLDWLRENGMLTGMGLGNGGLIGAKLSVRAEKVLEGGRPLQEAFAEPGHAGTSVQIGEVRGSAVSIGSPHSQQSVTNVDSFDSIRSVADLIERRATAAGGEIEREGLALAQGLRDELTRSTPDRSRLRQLLATVSSKFAFTLATVAGTSAAQEIVTHASDAMVGLA